MPYLKCIKESEARYILEEIHEEVYGDHAGSRSLVRLLEQVTSGLLCRETQRSSLNDATKCQRFGNVQCIPTKKLTPITFLWPFAQWEIDIMGTLPQGKRLVKFLLVAI